MRGHEDHGIRHVPLERCIIHATVGNMGYISKQDTKEQYCVMIQLKEALISTDIENFYWNSVDNFFGSVLLSSSLFSFSFMVSHPNTRHK